VNIFLSNDQTNFVSCEEEEERRRRRRKKREELFSGRGKKMRRPKNKFKKEKLSFHSLHFHTHN
jgi:hypothetical protein